MSFAWLQYEARILGRGANLGPILAIAGIGLIGVLMATSGTPHERVASTLTSLVELTIPLVVGILTTSIVSSDRAVELQRTVQTRYPKTLLRRIALLSGWSAVVASGASIVLVAAGYWVVPGSLAVAQLAWIAPTVWFIGAGVLLSVLLRSWSAAASLLGGIWLLQNVLDGWFLERDWARALFLFMTTHDKNADDWASTRLVVAGTGVILLAIGMLIKSRTESLEAGGAE